MLKLEILNSIVRAFGRELITSNNSSKHKKSIFNPDNLIQICTNAIKVVSFPFNTHYSSDNKPFSQKV